MLPFLLIILHFSQIGFTDDLTFTATASLPKKSNYNYSTIFSIWQALFKNSFIIYFYGRRYKRERYAGRGSIHLLLQAPKTSSSKCSANHTSPSRNQSLCGIHAPEAPWTDILSVHCCFPAQTTKNCLSLPQSQKLDRSPSC